MAGNPVIWSDYPDADVIRVEDTYYMVSTTMHFMPGAYMMSLTAQKGRSFRMEKVFTVMGCGPLPLDIIKIFIMYVLRQTIQEKHTCTSQKIFAAHGKNSISKDFIMMVPCFLTRMAGFISCMETVRYTLRN